MSDRCSLLSVVQDAKGFAIAGGAAGIAAAKALSDGMIRVLASVNEADVPGAIQRTGAKIVTFDVFDTLVSRDVLNPRDVLRLLERDFIRQYGRREPLAELRAAAEKEALMANGGHEPKLADIYKLLPLSDGERDWAMQREIEIERAVCVARPGMLDVWRQCLASGLELGIISDMYLPRTVIEEILKSCGYDGWKELYVSSDTGERKATGELFDRVIDDFGVPAQSIVHVGDSLRSDFMAARSRGMHAILMRRQRRTKYRNAGMRRWADSDSVLEYSVINAFVSNHAPDGLNYFEKVGYEAIGPILLGFSKWLANQSKDCDIQKLFFLTREGAVLKEAFETCGFGAELETNLIRVSRRSTAVPLLSECENLDDLMRQVRVPRAGTSVAHLAMVCGIDSEEIESILVRCGVDGSAAILELSASEQDRLYDALCPAIDRVSTEQGKLLREYLYGVGFAGKAGVVDVGWFGTIQDNLARLEKDVEITGFYLGRKQTFGGTVRPKRQRFFLFDSMYSRVGEKVSSAIEIFESCFLTSEGTTLGYGRLENGGAGPILGEPERNAWAANAMRSLQQAGMKFAIDFAGLAGSLGLELPADACSAAYCRFIDPPSRELMDEFGGLSMSDTGHDEYAPFVRGNLPHYIVHPRDFISDFNAPGSKGVFLKSTFPGPIPWPRILSTLRKLQGQRD